MGSPMTTTVGVTDPMSNPRSPISDPRCSRFSRHVSGEASVPSYGLDAELRQPAEVLLDEFKAGPLRKLPIPVWKKPVVVARIVVNRPYRWSNNEKRSACICAGHRILQDRVRIKGVFEYVEDANRSKPAEAVAFAKLRKAQA